ncbi:MAG: antibiotic biosynthesis monooxygenase [Anaerolineales bacterium]|nr:antibiotic biosynthesis monooxygenase [Anaerolineales bacterium]
MNIVLVHVHVKPEFVDAFKQASVENASNSVKEAGIARFDVIQQNDDPTRFILVEVYKGSNSKMFYEVHHVIV